MKIDYTTRVLVCLSIIIILSGYSVQANSSTIPLYYEDFASSAGRSLLSVNSKGEYFALYFGSCGTSGSAFIVKHDNDLNEMKRWNVPCPAGWNWFNDIAVDHSDNVWVAGSESYRRKQFVQFDSEGNHIADIIVSDRKLFTRADLGFVFDEANNLYFIADTYTGELPMKNTLYKINSKTGAIIKEWTVPVGLLPGGLDGGWHRGMAINSRGELFWGSHSTPEIYSFNPLLEESKYFTSLPGNMDTLQIAIDPNDNMYVLNGYPMFTIYMFDGTGRYVGEKGIEYDNCQDADGMGIASYLDEIVIASYKDSLLIKYTSDKNNSKEYLYGCYGPTDDYSPVTTAVITGTIGANGWHVSDVLVTLTATDEDGGSGVALTEYSFDGTTWNAYTSPFTINGEGATIVYYRSADNAGNIEITKNIFINIDKTPPVITISGVMDGATYPFNAMPVPGYSVTDAVSGVASSSASVLSDPANTFCISKYTYHVNATDNAGNAANASATYSVVVTVNGIMELIRQMLASGQIDNAGIANSLLAQIRNGNFNAFINHVEAQAGKHIASEAAELLIKAGACLI